MSGHKGLASFWSRLFGRRVSPSPAGNWLAARTTASPDAVVREYFAAAAAHDLDWMLATMAPERAQLYNQPRTVDKRRLTIAQVGDLVVAPTSESPEIPAFSSRYVRTIILRAEYVLDLVDVEQRRDPTLKEGPQWSYFVLVTQGRGRPWMIADWGQ